MARLIPGQVKWTNLLSFCDESGHSGHVQAVEFSLEVVSALPSYYGTSSGHQVLAASSLYTAPHPWQSIKDLAASNSGFRLLSAFCCSMRSFLVNGSMMMMTDEASLLPRHHSLLIHGWKWQPNRHRLNRTACLDLSVTRPCWLRIDVRDSDHVLRIFLPPLMAVKTHMGPFLSSKGLTFTSCLSGWMVLVWMT